MKSLDVEGIPEPIAQALAQLIQAIREQLQAQQRCRPCVTLPVHKGTILRPVTRDEIYEGID